MDTKALIAKKYSNFFDINLSYMRCGLTDRRTDLLISEQKIDKLSEAYYGWNVYDFVTIRTILIIDLVTSILKGYGHHVYHVNNFPRSSDWSSVSFLS